MDENYLRLKAAIRPHWGFHRWIHRQQFQNSGDHHDHCNKRNDILRKYSPKHFREEKVKNLNLGWSVRNFNLHQELFTRDLGWTYSDILLDFTNKQIKSTNSQAVMTATVEIVLPSFPLRLIGASAKRMLNLKKYFPLMFRASELLSLKLWFLWLQSRFYIDHRNLERKHFDLHVSKH